MNFLDHLTAEESGLKCPLPHAHMSTGFPYGSFLRTSGDKYPGVPANPAKVIWRSGLLVTQRARFYTLLCNSPTIWIACLSDLMPKTIRGGKYSPNHACWSPCTSIANPKSANLTAAPFSLLANKRFSGCWCEKGDGRWVHRSGIRNLIQTFQRLWSETALESAFV